MSPRHPVYPAGPEVPMNPRTEAGKRLMPWLSAHFFNRGGVLPAEAWDEAEIVILAIEAEAIAARDAELRARLPQALADADDAGSVADDWTGSEYVDRLAAALLDQPVVPMSPEP